MSSHSRWFFFAGLTLIAGLHAVRTDARDKSPVVEADKLPPRAVARLGSPALNHGDPIGALALAPNGKLAATGEIRIPMGLPNTTYDLNIRLWEIPTGREVRVITAPDEGPVTSLEFSPDGKTLVAGARKKLFLWDVSTGKETHQLPLDDSASLIRFTPDGKHLLIVLSNKLVIMTTKEALPIKGEKEQPKVLWDRKMVDATFHIRSLDLSPDGSRLALLLTKGKASRDNPGQLVRVLDVATGKQLFQAERERLSYGVALSPDKKHVVFGNEQLAVWDIAQDKKVREFPLVAAPGPPVEGVPEWQAAYALSYSPDGKILAVMHNFDTVLWDAASGKKIGEMYHRPIFDPFLAREVFAFSKDSKLLTVGGSHVLRLVDTTTGKEITAWPGHRSSIRTFDFSFDGRTLFSRSESEICAWQTNTWQLANHHSLLSYGPKRVLARSNESKFLITSDKDEFFLEDMTTGKLLAKFPAKENVFKYAMFSFDGKIACLYAFASGRVTVGFFSLPDCKELHKLEVDNVISISFSPVSRGFAWKDAEGTFVEVDAHTGKVVRKVGRLGHEEGGPIDFLRSVHSWDDRYILFRTETGSGDSARQGYRFWDFKTRRVACTYLLPPDMFIYDFTYDNRLLIFILPEKAGLRVLELASGKERRPLIGGHMHGPTRLATSPIDWTVASGIPGNTILMWDLSLPRKKLTRPQFTDDELSALWRDLASDDALKAEDAIESLVQTPPQAVPFLRKHLKPVAALDPTQTKRLIADLGSENFVVREKASVALEKVLELAEPALQQTLAKEKPTVETRRRIEQLLGKLPRAIDTATLQSLRALEVAEKIGSADARQMIEALARGAPSARLTDEAMEARRRLQRQR